MQNILEAVAKDWGWAGIIPKRVIDTNKFGNVIFEHANGFIWRIVPEELSCEIIAKDVTEYEEISKVEEFVQDWNMEGLAQAAEAVYGPLTEGMVFYLVLPAALGGEYSVANVNVLPIEELISVSGTMAFQIKDLPDGGEVQIKIEE